METSCCAPHMASAKQQKHLTLSFAIKTKNYNSRVVRHWPKTGDWERLWRQFRTPSLAKKQISPTFFYFLINDALLYHFLANWLAHNKKIIEKSVFREAWSPELTSQSFPVSCFWCRSFVPHRKWNLTLLAHQNTGKENRYRKKILLHLPAHWGDLIEQIKKKRSVIYTLRSLG